MTMKRFTLLGIAFLILILPHTVSGQNETSRLKGYIQKRKAKKEKALEEGTMWISPIFGPGYTPELGFLVTVGGLITFKTNPNDTLIQRSSSNLNLAVTSTGAIVASALPVTYWFKDKFRAEGELWYKDMPDHYFGVGYKTNSALTKDDSVTKYSRQWWMVKVRPMWQFTKNNFLGMVIDFNETVGYDVNPYMEYDPYIEEFGLENYNVGFGLILRHDSRDIPVNAWKGFFADISATFYGKYFGAQNRYQVYQVDLRYYKTIHRKGMVLAGQAKSRVGVGDVPWGEVSMLGSPFDLRGYYWGQYRDKSMIYFIAEYRHTFLKKGSRDLSKSGVVGWIATGSIAPGWNEYTYWLPNFGIGYRYEIQPRMNVRLDLGFGKESRGIYFNFTEAF